MATRQEFLGRIAREVGRARGSFPAAPAARPAAPDQAAELVRRQMAERWPEALERFRQEFERVAGVFHRVPTVRDVPGAVLAIAREQRAQGIVTWDPPSLGLDLRSALEGTGLSVAFAEGVGDADRRRHREEAARADLGVTGADFAIAETGTLVLLSGAGRPRSTSLLPATHVAVLDRTRLLESLEQMGVVLESLHLEPGRTSGAVISFITGPSRTADIELTLTRGVHGPKDVHAVFVDEPLSAA
jgi:L-lactate dehydrogenase complex protein LldG